MKLHVEIYPSNVSFLDLAAFPDNVLTKYCSKNMFSRNEKQYFMMP